MSESINAVKTRVIRVSEGQYMPQLSTDGMMWFDMKFDGWREDFAIDFAISLKNAAGRLPSKGEVVFIS